MIFIHLFKLPGMVQPISCLLVEPLYALEAAIASAGDSGHAHYGVQREWAMDLRALGG